MRTQARIAFVVLCLVLALSALAQTVSPDYLVTATGVTLTLPDKATGNLVVGPASTVNGEVQGTPQFTLLSKSFRTSGYIQQIVESDPNKEVFVSGAGRFWRNGSDKSTECTTIITLRTDRKVRIEAVSGPKELLDTGLVTISSGVIFLRQIRPTN